MNGTNHLSENTEIDSHHEAEFQQFQRGPDSKAKCEAFGFLFKPRDS